MRSSHRHFVPAAGYDWLLPFYDPLWKLMGGHRLRLDFVERTNSSAGQRVLDIGCGTGSLLVFAKQRLPDISFTGLDPDAKALARARAKAEAASVEVGFEQGFAEELPFPAGSFDQAWSSMMFHHLDPDVKKRVLREVLRVLSPDGVFHLVDFSGSTDGSDGLLARLLHSHDARHGGEYASLSALMEEAGLLYPAKLASQRTLFGSVSHQSASAPKEAA
jgi:ubiquinone/menaquinone biosynthesis C-methylase UbiE